MPSKHILIAIRQLEKNTGASRGALSHAAMLQRAGYRVTFIAERANRALIEGQQCELIKIARWPFRGAFRRIWFDKRVQACARKLKPALLISHGDAETTGALFLHNCVHLASQKIHRAPLPTNHEVAQLHDRILSRQAFAQLFVNSHLMGEEVMRRYGIAASKIQVMHPGYDPSLFNIHDRTAKRAAGRKALGLDDRAIVIGLVTSGDFKKRNVAGFLNACAQLKTMMPDQPLRFLVVGKDEFGPYQQQAEQSGIGKQVLHCLPQDNVAHIYAALELFVLPAHIEEFGQVAVEAMACGTPVLLSDQVGAAEVLGTAPGFQNRILPTHNLTNWANAMHMSIFDQAGAQADALRLAGMLSKWQYAEQQSNVLQKLQQLVK